MSDKEIHNNTSQNVTPKSNNNISNNNNLETNKNQVTQDDMLLTSFVKLLEAKDFKKAFQLLRHDLKKITSALHAQMSIILDYTRTKFQTNGYQLIKYISSGTKIAWQKITKLSSQFIQDLNLKQKFEKFRYNSVPKINSWLYNSAQYCSVKLKQIWIYSAELVRKNSINLAQKLNNCSWYNQKVKSPITNTIYKINSIFIKK